MSLSVAVAGASGYAGGELLRVLAAHPDLDVTTVTAFSNAGQPLISVQPHLRSLAHLTFVAPVWIVVFAILGAAILGTMGVIAGIWAEKFDQLAAFQNFLIMPATFLAGVFYSVQKLPPFWLAVSHFNPFFYMIDGFRYGFFGQSDVSPWTSLAIVSVFFAVLTAMAINLLKRGYKLRH